jgi:hypothetical protein
MISKQSFFDSVVIIYLNIYYKYYIKKKKNVINIGRNENGSIWSSNPVMEIMTLLYMIRSGICLKKTKISEITLR